MKLNLKMKKMMNIFLIQDYLRRINYSGFINPFLKVYLYFSCEMQWFNLFELNSHLNVYFLKKC